MFRFVTSHYLISFDIFIILLIVQILQFFVIKSRIITYLHAVVVSELKLMVVVLTDSLNE
jgi:hypothetical protein